MNDLISRQAVLDMANGWTYNFCDQEDEWAAMKEIRELPSAEPERKKPDHGYMWICPVCGLEVHSDFVRCVRCGWERTSAEPERKRGRWINAECKDGTIAHKCSECKCLVGYSVSSLAWFNFCPWCGADMRGGNDG